MRYFCIFVFLLLLLIAVISCWIYFVVFLLWTVVSVVVVVGVALFRVFLVADFVHSDRLIPTQRCNLTQRCGWLLVDRSFVFCSSESVWNLRKLFFFNEERRLRVRFEEDHRCDRAFESVLRWIALRLTLKVVMWFLEWLLLLLVFSLLLLFYSNNTLLYCGNAICLSSLFLDGRHHDLTFKCVRGYSFGPFVHFWLKMRAYFFFIFFCD